jgi:outer membrane protein assembly factor BamB
MSKFLLIIFLFLICSCSTLRIQGPVKITESDWIQYGNSPQRHNIASHVVKPPLELVWIYDAQAGFGKNSPLVFDKFILIGTLGEEIQIIDAETGKRVGVRGVESAVEGTPAIYRYKIIVPSAYGKETLECFDITSGRRIWAKKIGYIEASLLVLDSILIVGTLDGKLYSFIIGKDKLVERWRFSASKPIRSSPASDGKIVAFGCDDGNIYCVDIEKGKLRWKYKTDAPIFAPISIGSDVVIAGSLDGSIYAIEINTGELAWKFDANSKIYGGFAVKDTIALVGTASGKLLAINIKDGSKMWEFGAGSIINSSPIVSGNTVYFGSLDKNIYALDISTGNLIWKFETRGRIKTSPVIWKDMLIIAGEDKYLYGFKTQVSTER